MFALTILMIVAAGVMPLALVAVKATENQGHLAARTTEYAQDKLEQLMALSYGDSVTDTRIFPSADVGGSGLTIGGSANPDAPVASTSTTSTSTATSSTTPTTPAPTGSTSASGRCRARAPT